MFCDVSFCFKIDKTKIIQSTKCMIHIQLAGYENCVSEHKSSVMDNENYGNRLKFILFTYTIQI